MSSALLPNCFSHTWLPLLSYLARKASVPPALAWPGRVPFVSPVM